MRNMIIEYVWRSESIKKLSGYVRLPNFISKDELKSHLISELVDMDETKLTNHYNNGSIDALCMGIMINSIKKTGRLYRLLNKGVEELGIIGDIVDDEAGSDLLPILKKALNEYEMKKKEDFLEMNYHFEILKLYYWDKMTYKAIEELTGIKSDRVRKSILRSRAWLKDYIKKENEK